MTHTIAYAMGEEEEKARAKREKKDSNNWHTEKPTEKGYCVLTFPNELGFADYCVGYWNGEKILIRDAWEGDEVKPIAWQKIEPYKETQ